MAQFVITTAGINALINAQNTGTAPIAINEVGVGSAAWSPDETATALVDEIKRIPVTAGAPGSDNRIHVNALDSSTDSWEAHEVGVYLEDGTLLAVASGQQALASKAADAHTGISAQLFLVGTDNANVTFDRADFKWNDADTQHAGVVQLATEQKTLQGEANDLAVTPQGLASFAAEQELRFAPIFTVYEATATELSPGVTVEVVTEYQMVRRLPGPAPLVEISGASTNTVATGFGIGGYATIPIGLSDGLGGSFKVNWGGIGHGSAQRGQDSTSDARMRISAKASEYQLDDDMFTTNELTIEVLDSDLDSGETEDISVNYTVVVELADPDQQFASAR